MRVISSSLAALSSRSPTTYSFSSHPSLTTLKPFFSKPIYQVLTMTMIQLEKLLGSLKSKLRALKMKKPYNKIDKSESMRVEIRSRRARKLIDETLKIADSPGHKSYAI